MAFMEGTPFCEMLYAVMRFWFTQPYCCYTSRTGTTCFGPSYRHTM